MNDKEHLQAIRANLDDDAPRLVYADALSERGDPRGELLIVVQCAKAKLEREGRGYSPEHLLLLKREEELLAKHENAWLTPYRLGFLDHDFERGFLVRAKVDAAAVRTRWARLRELPLVSLVIRSGGRLGDLASLAKKPGSLREVTIEMGTYEATFDASALFAILHDVDEGDATPAWSADLPESLILPAVRALVLTRPRPDHVASVARVPGLARLSIGGVHDRAAEALFQTTLPALRDLHVWRTANEEPFTPDVAAAFERATFLEQLVAFRSHLPLDARMASVLERRMPHVTRLAFDGVAAAGGIEALLATAITPQLRELVLTAHEEETAAALVGGRFDRLERLTLQRFTVRPEETHALPPVPRVDAYHCQWEPIGLAKAELRKRWPQAVMT